MSLRPGENKLPVLAQAFLLRDRRDNSYREGPAVPGQSCHLCVRRRYTDLIACRDGWPIYAEPWGSWEDRGGTCANFKEASPCPS